MNGYELQNNQQACSWYIRMRSGCLYCRKPGLSRRSQAHLCNCKSGVSSPSVVTCPCDTVPAVMHWRGSGDTPLDQILWACCYRCSKRHSNAVLSHCISSAMHGHGLHSVWVAMPLWALHNSRGSVARCNAHASFVTCLSGRKRSLMLQGCGYGRVPARLYGFQPQGVCSAASCGFYQRQQWQQQLKEE